MLCLALKVRDCSTFLYLSQSEALTSYRNPSEVGALKQSARYDFDISTFQLYRNLNLPMHVFTLKSANLRCALKASKLRQQICTTVRKYIFSIKDGISI